MNKETLTITDVCKLAHELTIRDCKRLKIVIDIIKDENTVYTKQSQTIFDDYYDLINNTLN